MPVLLFTLILEVQYSVKYNQRLHNYYKAPGQNVLEQKYLAANTNRHVSRSCYKVKFFFHSEHIVPVDGKMICTVQLLLP